MFVFALNMTKHFINLFALLMSDIHHYHREAYTGLLSSHAMWVISGSCCVNQKDWEKKENFTCCNFLFFADVLELFPSYVMLWFIMHHIRVVPF